MNILVTGASSQIGYFLVPRLLHAGHKVIAISRQDRPAWIAEHAQLTWESLPQLSAAERNTIEAIVSAGPLGITLELLQECTQLKALAVISTSSIRFKQDSEHHGEADQIKIIAAQEQQLRQRADAAGIACAVLRPTLVYGAGLDNNLCRLARLAERIGRIPVAREANGLRQPVHADDLAQACVRLMQQPCTGLWYVGGETRLRYRQMAEAVCLALGYGRLLRMPLWLGKMLLGVLQLTGRFRDANANMLVRQRQDLCVDNQPASEAWGWTPRAFALEPAMLRPPDHPFASPEA